MGNVEKVRKRRLEQVVQERARLLGLSERWTVKVGTHADIAKIVDGIDEQYLDDSNAITAADPNTMESTIGFAPDFITDTMANEPEHASHIIWHELAHVIYAETEQDWPRWKYLLWRLGFTWFVYDVRIDQREEELCDLLADVFARAHGHGL